MMSESQNNDSLKKPSKEDKDEKLDKKASKGDIKNLETQQKELETKCNNVQSDNSKIWEQIGALQKQIDNKKTEDQERTEEIQSVKDHKSILDTRIENLEKEVEKKDKERKDEIEDFKGNVTSLENWLENLKQDIQTKEQERKAEIDKLRQKISENEDKVSVYFHRMVQLTAVCTVIFGIVGGFWWSSWYNFRNVAVDPAITEFISQIKETCEQEGIKGSFECFQYMSHSENKKVTDVVNNLVTFCKERNQSIDECLPNLGKSTEVVKDDSLTKKLSSLQKEHSYMIKEFNQTVAKLKENFNHSIHQLEVVLGTCQVNVSQQKIETEKMLKKIKQLETNQSVTRDQQEYTTHTTVPLNLFVIVSLILGVGEFCIIVLLCYKAKMYTSDQGPVTDNIWQNGAPVHVKKNKPQSVLDGIRRSAMLDDSVCIVSFNGSTQSKHCEMVNSFIDPSIHKRPFLVNKHEELKHLPPSKICFVFVDYNARNIILESEQELGDIRKTTVKAIQIIGGEVILVYCGDEYAMVEKNDLYNPGLSSVKNHPELKQLEAKQCVLTVHQDKGFIDYQKQHLKVLTAKLLKH